MLSYNGSLGTVEKIKGDTLAVKLDGGGAYTLDAKVYKDFQLGYAGTVYRGQGKTIDQAFVLYSSGMDKKTAYVAMTRARQQTKIYVAREDAPDLQTVVKNIDSRKHYGASLNYGIKPESQNQPQQARPQPQKESSQQEQEQARLERARLHTEQLREQRHQRERERGLDRGR
jgi:ATP-dependent exoDNAse (exonuclease V) alpha subunit